MIDNSKGGEEEDIFNGDNGDVALRERPRRKEEKRKEEKEVGKEAQTAHTPHSLLFQEK